MQFSRLLVLSVIFHQVFSSGSNNFSSEKLRTIVLFWIWKKFTLNKGSVRSVAICIFLARDVNLWYWILKWKYYIILSVYKYKYCFLASLQLGCQVGLGMIPHWKIHGIF